MNTNKHENLLYKELSYQIQGAAIEVRKNFGPGHKESIYQNAFAEELKSRSVNFEREQRIKIHSPKTGKVIGYYQPDFVIDNKIIVELKAVKKIPKEFLDQLYDYLRNSKYELGYFVNFSSPKLYLKRIIFTNDRKFSKFKNVLVVLGLILVSISVSPIAKAATLYFIPPSEQIYKGDVFSVEIRLDSKDEPINAAQVDVDFPFDKLEVVSIEKLNSFLRFWPQEPAFSNALGLASLVGGLPTPGFRDNNGLIGVIKFKAKDIGFGNLNFRDTSQVLLNDGLGTKASFNSKSAFLAIAAPAAGYEPKLIAPIVDIAPPLAFVPVISRTELAFGGKYFVVFETQDLESGIDYYEIQEIKDGEPGEWRVAVSPHVLKNQEGTIKVLVKAVDRAGNETIGEAKVIITKKKLFTYLILFSIFLGLVIWKIIQYVRDVYKKH